ncbi:MAG: hypothetical protein AAF368_09700, partial [Planctomycetota bacterium]
GDHKWSLKGKGSYYPGEYYAFNEEKNVVVLRNAEGKDERRVAVSKLAAGAVTYLDAIRVQAADEAADKHVAEVMSNLTYEDWESSNGVVIRAKFISFDGDQVSIEKEGTAQTFDLPLGRLSESSQARAREIAASLVPSGNDS